jgi:chromosome segregation ATPase
MFGGLEKFVPLFVLAGTILSNVFTYFLATRKNRKQVQQKYLTEVATKFQESFAKDNEDFRQELRKENKELKDELCDLNNKYRDLSKKYNELEAELKATREERDSLLGRVDKLEKQRAGLIGKIAQLNNTIKTIKGVKIKPQGKD